MPYRMPVSVLFVLCSSERLKDALAIHSTDRCSLGPPAGPEQVLHPDLVPEAASSPPPSQDNEGKPPLMPPPRHKSQIASRKSQVASCESWGPQICGWRGVAPLGFGVWGMDGCVCIVVSCKLETCCGCMQWDSQCMQWDSHCGRVSSLVIFSLEWYNTVLYTLLSRA